MNFFEKLMGIVSKSMCAVSDAQIPDVWVFTHRNTTPWARKEAINNTLSFYPETKRFFKESDIKNSTSKKSMDDLVTAEVLDASGLIVSDVTEFLHTIRWSQNAPSVYELVLIFFLLHDILLSQNLLSTYVLRVMTIDAETLDIPLDDTKAKEEFSSWGGWSPLVERQKAPLAKREEI
jgi:hypothetical protein